MRWGKTTRLLFATGLAIALSHATVLAAGRIRLAQTSTVTNCMMTCNSQAATCQTTCLVPGTPPTGAATPTIEHDADELQGPMAKLERY